MKTFTLGIAVLLSSTFLVRAASPITSGVATITVTNDGSGKIVGPVSAATIATANGFGGSATNASLVNGISGPVSIHGTGVQTNSPGNYSISGGGGTNGGLPGDGVFIKTNSLTQLTINTNANSQATAWVLQLALASIQSNTFFVSFTNVSGPVSGIGATTNNGTNLIVWQTNAPAGSTNGLAPLTNGIFSGASNAATGLPLADTSVTNGLASTGFVNTSIASANTNQVYLNVLLYGAVADGMTDNTIVLSNLFSTNNSSWYFPPGHYLSQELMITNGVAIQMAPGALLVYAMNAWNTNIFIREMLNTNITLVNFAIDGQQYPNIAAGTNTWFGWDGGSWALHPFTLSEIFRFQYWNPNGLRHGLQVNIDQVGECRNVSVKGFNGCGVLPLSIGGSVDYVYPKLEFTSANIQSNFMGLYCVEPNTVPGYITNWQTNYVPNAQTPEYEHFAQFSIQGNVVGMDFYAANSVIDNSHLVDNYIGALDNAPEIFNNHHGVISHCFFNHAVTIPLYLQGVLQSELIDGCYFAGNGDAIIGMDNCTGVTFQGCVFENTMYFRINQQQSVVNGRNFLLNNKYTGTWSNNIASNMLNDGSLLWQGNYSYDTAPDNDGSPLSQIGATNGPNTVFTNALSVSSTVTAASFIGSGHALTGVLTNLIASGPGSNNFDRASVTNLTVGGSLTIGPGSNYITGSLNVGGPFLVGSTISGNGSGISNAIILVSNYFNNWGTNAPSVVLTNTAGQPYVSNNIYTNTASWSGGTVTSGINVTGTTAGITNTNTVGFVGNGSGVTNLQYTSLTGAVWLNTASSPTTYNIAGPARLYITNASTVLLVVNGVTNTLIGTGTVSFPEKVEIDQIGTNYITSY
jgi:hypothetical protein